MGSGQPPLPAINIEHPGQCVAPKLEMRRNHMEMLKHQRDRTLRLGERKQKISLNGCVECHASRYNGSVLGNQDNFCEGCHSYVAVKLDCWECHQPRTRLSAISANQEVK